MNDYIIVNDPYRGVHLEHKKYKYLKREWKNGRWNYTYPKYGSKDAPYAVYTKGHAKTLSDDSSDYMKEANKHAEWAKDADAAKKWARVLKG